MTRQAGSWIRGVGIALIVIGVVGTIVVFFQPWRSCDYEDTSAGCAVLPRDAALMVVAFLITGVGIVMTLAAAVRSRGRQPTP
jgi:hypothetical protein